MSIRPSVCVSLGLSVCLCFFVYLSVCVSACLCTCLSVYLSVCLSVCLCICLSVYLSVCVSVCLSVYLSVCVSVCLCICLSVCLCICLSVCLFVFYLIVCLLAHLSVCCSLCTPTALYSQLYFDLLCLFLFVGWFNCLHFWQPVVCRLFVHFILCLCFSPICLLVSSYVAVFSIYSCLSVSLFVHCVPTLL